MAKTIAKTEVNSKLYNETFSVELTYFEGLDNGNPWDEPYHMTEVYPNNVYSRDFASFEEAATAFEASSNWLMKSHMGDWERDNA